MKINVFPLFMLQCIRDFRVYAYTRYFIRVYAYTLDFSGVHVHTSKIHCIKVYHNIWVVYIIAIVVKGV